MRALILLPFLIWSTFAQDCSNYSRAVVSDQKNMASDVALKYLQVKQDKVTLLEVQNYVSWKENQKGCLADVIHYAQVIVETKAEDKRCLTTMDLHTKDDFTSGAQFEREYKVRNVKTSCHAETPEQLKVSALCESALECPRESGTQLIKDYQDGCKCKYFDEIILFEDTGAQYDNFFSVLNLVKKPEGLKSPF